MAGALAERVFADKLGRAGFEDVWVGGHRPTSIDEASLYPLFTDSVIALMRSSMPPEQHDHVATAVIVKACKPASEGKEDAVADRGASRDELVEIPNRRGVASGG